MLCLEILLLKLSFSHLSFFYLYFFYLFIATYLVNVSALPTGTAELQFAIMKPLVSAPK